MSTALDELVGLLASPNPEVRAAAVENLAGYSTARPSIFKADGLVPVRNLKVLIQDRPQIAQNALTILVNIAADAEVLEFLAGDEKFLDVVLSRITRPTEPCANLLGMLLANLAKWDGLQGIVTRRQEAPPGLGSDELVMNQLVDVFVRGGDGSYNPEADYHYLAYLFADLAKHQAVRQYFVGRQDYDSAIPLTKLQVFTGHWCEIRRKGVASTIKNVAFDVPSHPLFLSGDEMDVLPHILLPLVGNEKYDEEDAMAMVPEVLMAGADKEREKEASIIQTHVDTLMLLTTTREGREVMRAIRVYPIIRETHLRVPDEGVRLACERLVQVLMLDEEPEKDGPRVGEAGDSGDEDERIVEV